MLISCRQFPRNVILIKFRRCIKGQGTRFFSKCCNKYNSFGIMGIYINLTRQSRHFDITVIASSVQGAVLSFNISLITLFVNIWTPRII